MFQATYSYSTLSMIGRKLKRQPALILLTAIALLLAAYSNPKADKTNKAEQPAVTAPVESKSQADKAENWQPDSEVALLSDPKVECSSYDAARRIGFGTLKDGYHFSFNSWDRDGNHGFKCVLMISCIQDSSWLSSADESDADAQNKVLEKLKLLIPRIVKDKQAVSKIIADLKPENITRKADDPIGWFVHTQSNRYNSIDVKINYQEFFFTVTVYCSGF